MSWPNMRWRECGSDTMPKVSQDYRHCQKVNHHVLSSLLPVWGWENLFVSITVKYKTFWLILSFFSFLFFRWPTWLVLSPTMKRVWSWFEWLPPKLTVYVHRWRLIKVLLFHNIEHWSCINSTQRGNFLEFFKIGKASDDGARIMVGRMRGRDMSNV